ncbi:MAG TPA: PaaI family thioesterase [Noviherbaspirillum sp.]|jgi:uncharacterized protein (TIGR00369 family)|uniref:PaaI family thioesterase n=1 Tax=Noviherbaspirillum sp. TaxID=1926288 RepID=UPI002F9521EB
MNEAEILAQWQADEAAVRPALLPPGVATREQLRERTGIAFLEDIKRGVLPPAPIAALLDFVPILADHGRMVFQGTPGPQHYNPIGMVHGGYAATLLDSCVGCAIHSVLPAGKGYSTLELKVNYIRALTDKTGPVRAEGRVINVGNQVAVAEGRITDVQGRLYAHATTTCLVFPI